MGEDGGLYAYYSIEGRTGITPEDGGRRVFIHILNYWRKGPYIDPVDCEDGAMKYIYMTRYILCVDY